MRADKNETVIRRLFEEIFTKGNVDITDELFSSDYVEHQHIPVSTAKHLFTQWRKAYSSVHFTVQELGEDRVVARSISCPTRQSAHSDLPPSRTPRLATGIDIYRLRNGKVVEHWGSSDIELLH